MNKRSLEQLRMDRRLAGRKGWLSREGLAGEAADLPDAGGKIAEKVEPDPGETDTVPPEADPQTPTGLDTA